MDKKINKKMKITFLALYDTISLGIRALQAITKKEKYDTNIIYLKELIPNHITNPTQKEMDILISKLKELNSDVLCMSISSPIHKIAEEVTKEIREKFPKLKIIWGGIHPTTNPEKSIPHADYICVGEGEYAILELLDSIKKNKSTTKILNIWTRNKGKISKNEIRPLIQDLDSIPLSDYTNKNKWYIGEDKITNTDPIHRLKEYPIMAGRGCPYQCTYCQNSYLFELYKGKGRYIRKRSVENVIKELKHAKKTLKNINSVFFFDEVFATNADWIKKFVIQYKKEIDIDFGCEFHPSTVKEETVRILKEAGLVKSAMGIQSGSENIRKNVFKRSDTDEMIIKASEVFKKFNIKPYYDLILNNPYETKKDMKQGIKMLLKLSRPYNLHVFSLVNMPKTLLTEDMIRKGMISEDNVTEALTQWRLNVQLSKKDAIIHNCLVNLISKNFVPLRFINYLSNTKYIYKNPKMLLRFTVLCNRIKFFIEGIHHVLAGDFNLKNMKVYISKFKNATN